MIEFIGKNKTKSEVLSELQKAIPKSPVAVANVCFYLATAKSKIQRVYIFESATPKRFETAKGFIKEVAGVYMKYNIGEPKDGAYDRDTVSKRRGKPVSKLGTGRAKDRDDNGEVTARGNSKLPTFRKKALPGLEALGFVAGAAELVGKDKTSGDPTLSYMAYPFVGSFNK